MFVMFPVVHGTDGQSIEIRVGAIVAAFALLLAIGAWLWKVVP
jgi:hypothetical protein